MDAGDCTPKQRLPATSEEQTQIALDCFDARAARRDLLKASAVLAGGMANTAAGLTTRPAKASIKDMKERKGS
jgi:hypothetical protein